MWKLLCSMALGALMALASRQELENEEVARLNERVESLLIRNAIRRETVERSFVRITELETRVVHLQNYIRELEDTISSEDMADLPIGPGTI
jgi:hypothetical protein